MNSSKLGSTLSEYLFPLKDEITPLAAATGCTSTVIIVASTADDIAKGLHPALLVLAGVGIEIDNLPVVEADTETLFDKHVTFLFFRKGRTASLAVATRGLGVRQLSSVIDESPGVGQIDGSTRLTGCLVVSSKLSADELEVTSTPVLFITRVRNLIFMVKGSG